jgi:hypothetical protein
MAGKRAPDKRLNRTVSVAEAASGALDPVLRKRGFASRDIISHWNAMAPPPYDRVAMPDRIVWPRGKKEAGGATLYLRCQAGHQLALAHEGGPIAAAVNRYFGYVLVGEVRLSATPMAMGKPAAPAPPAEPSPEARARIEASLAGVEDDGLRKALRQLGEGIAGRSARK